MTKAMMLAVLMCMSCVAQAQPPAKAPKKPAKAAPAEVVPHQSFPVPLGQPIEALPDKLREEDQLAMKVVRLEEQVAQLQHNLLQLQQASATCETQLLQCSAPQVQKMEQDGAAERRRRVEEIKKKYKLDADDIVLDDGTVKRAVKPAKK